MSEPFTAYRCADCEELYGRAPAACRACGSETFDAAELSGRGRLYSSTVVRVPGSDHQGQEPFVVGIVDVGDEETVRVTARLEGECRYDPDSPVAFVESREDTFVFAPPDDK